MAADAEYCPFCGARLHDEDDPLFAHLREHERCEDRFRTWDFRKDPPSGPARAQSRMRSVVMWIIIAVVLGYSVVIVQQLLLGVLAAGVVFLAFRWQDVGARLSQ